jgi:hypothetical protein
MRTRMQLESLLTSSGKTLKQQSALFALLNLGLIESLANGLMSTTDAVQIFFNADNCLFVRKHLRVKMADEIMSHGVQLSDLFDALPPEEAQRQFQRELAIMRSLCLKLLDTKRLVA